jgi:hypothetical protein
VHRELRLRALIGTLPPGMVVTPRQPTDGDATVWEMLPPHRGEAEGDAPQARSGGGISGVVQTEANRFVWPGPDLRPSRPGDASSVAYGQRLGAFCPAPE